MTRLFLDPVTPIACPKCGHSFPLAEGFARNALESVESASSDALAKVRDEERVRQKREDERFAKERDAAHQRAIAEIRQIDGEERKLAIAAMKRQVEESQAQLNAIKMREAELEAREGAIEARVAESAAAKAAELVAGERSLLTEQLQQRELQLAEARAVEVQLRKDKAQVEDRAAALEVEVARKLDAGRAEIEARVRSSEHEKSAMEKAELRKTIEDMKVKLQEANQKAEQGSQQLQGEVLELAIEEGLRFDFPMDTIVEVKKGARGGDVLQKVMTRTQQQAGLILWETKRAKDFSAQWIPKLKEDMRAAGADLGVLVTMPNALPADWPANQQFGLHEDLWVTVPATALQVAEALRVMLLDVHKQRLVSAGKGEKMEAVYDYVTSSQFAQKLKAVYSAFERMREDLEQERNVTMQRWARREKQLQVGVASLLGVGGDIQGIAQLAGPGLQLAEESGS